MKLANHLADGWDAAGAWITSLVETHERTIELGAVWTLLASSALLATCGFALFWSMLGSSDRTPFGTSLRGLTLALGLFGTSNVFLWGISLWVYYTGYEASIWERTGIRLFVALMAVLVGLAVIWVIWAYRKENWGRPERLRKNRKVLISSRRMNRNR